VAAAGGGDVGSLHLGRERAASRDSINEEKDADLCEKPLSSPCHGRFFIEEEAHGLGLAPGGGYGRAAGLEAAQSRARAAIASSLGFLSCFLLQISNIVPVPRFRLERRCSHRRRVVVKVVVVVVRGDGTSAARPLLGKKKNLTLSRFALSSAPPPNRCIRTK
jgi:hypothetical protein